MTCERTFVTWPILLLLLLLAGPSVAWAGRGDPDDGRVLYAIDLSESPDKPLSLLLDFGPGVWQVGADSAARDVPSAVSKDLVASFRYSSDMRMAGSTARCHVFVRKIHRHASAAGTATTPAAMTLSSAEGPATAQSYADEIMKALKDADWEITLPLKALRTPRTVKGLRRRTHLHAGHFIAVDPGVRSSGTGKSEAEVHHVFAVETGQHIVLFLIRGRGERISKFMDGIRFTRRTTSTRAMRDAKFAFSHAGEDGRAARLTFRVPKRFTRSYGARPAPESERCTPGRHMARWRIEQGEGEALAQLELCAQRLSLSLDDAWEAWRASNERAETKLSEAKEVRLPGKRKGRQAAGQRSDARGTWSVEHLGILVHDTLFVLTTERLGASKQARSAARADMRSLARTLGAMGSRPFRAPSSAR